MANPNFTPRVKRALQEAKILAETSNHLEVCVPHLLCAIMDKPEGAVLECLRKAGATKTEIEAIIEDLLLDIDSELFKPEGVGPDTTITYSFDCQKVLAESSKFSNSIGFDYISTEHVFFQALCIENWQQYCQELFIRNGIDISSVKTIFVEYFVECSNSKTKQQKKSNQQSKKKANQQQKQTQQKSKEKENSALETFSVNVNNEVLSGKTDPVFGREQEISELSEVLLRKNKCNAILVGDAGVGKTSIIYSLVEKIVTGQAPELLLGKRIYSIDLASMVAGAKYRGQFEERIKAIIDEASKDENVILFIDEIHTLVGAGSAEGSLDAANILKPYLSRGQIKCIGATTEKEYSKYFEKDAALNRRFQAIRVKEPSKEEAVKILEHIKQYYEDYHGVWFTKESIQEIVELSSKFIPYSKFPDKAIDVLDRVGSKLKIKKYRRPKEVLVVEDEIIDTLKKWEKSVENEDEEASRIYDLKHESLMFKHTDMLEKWADKVSNKKIKATKQDIYNAISEISSIPVKDLSKSESEKILGLKEILRQNIIGQDVDVIADAILRNKAGLRDGKKPIGAFMLLGPSGTGKTLLSKTIARELFGGVENLISLDMSEYMDKISVNKMIGGAAGYVGYEDGGILTEAVKKKPHSVVLFDEIEKAHPEVIQILLQILEEGRLTDNFGKSVDFSHCIVIITGNVGSESFAKDNTVGFGASSVEATEGKKQKVLLAAKSTFKPEFLNRLDEVVVYTPLSEDDMPKITQIELSYLAQNLRSKKIDATFDDSLIQWLSKKGFDKALGARPLKRCIEKHVANIIAEEILRKNVKEGSKIKLSINEDKIICEKIG